jgi:hypothetical protein
MVTKAKPVKEAKVAPVVVPLPVAKTAPKEPKLLPSERRAMKRREAANAATQIFGTGKGSTEPTIRALSYQIDLMHALNYYNSAYDSKDKRKWTMAYVGKARANEFDSLSDYHFNSVGTIIRMKMRDVYLEEKELNFIETKIAELRELSAAGGLATSSLKGGAKVKVDKPVVSIQDRVAEAASTHIGEINGLIDDFIMNGTEVDVGSYLKANNVSPQVSKLIPVAFDKFIQELTEYLEGKDKQLVEGYGYLGKTKAKKLLKSLEAISTACQQQVVTAKAVRKPRARKEKPASVLAAKVKFMKEFTELKLKSELPVKIVGASEVWVYNTKYKKIQVYRSLGTLSLKGTTILNYDVATSGAKTMRKPELVTGYVGMTKRTLGAEFKNMKTKESAVNGRINTDCVILKIFL